MIIEALTKPLTVDEIDFRIQSINKGGYATVLAYKDARVDMSRLDLAFGPMGWQRKHEVIDGNLHCHIGAYHTPTNQWVWKSDVGTESFTEKEKGEASDSFKRAGFNWGIGRDLYDFPFMSIPLKDHEWEMKTFNGKETPKATYKLRLRDWVWTIEYMDNKKLRYLSAKDENGYQRFEHYSMDGLQKSIDIIKEGIEQDDPVKVFENWDELDDGAKLVLWRAVSKGGPFSHQEKEYIRESSKHAS